MIERWKPIYLETKIDSKEQTFEFQSVWGHSAMFLQRKQNFRENKFLKKRKPKDLHQFDWKGRKGNRRLAFFQCTIKKDEAFMGN